MSEGARGLAAAMRALGLRAECLPTPDRESLRLGRRHTSGKECLPVCITLGSFLQRVLSEQDRSERFALFMPSAKGPCRFGVYSLFQKVVVDQLGFGDRVQLWSPDDRRWFEGAASGFPAIAAAGMMAADALSEGLYDVRPVETRPGAAAEIHGRYLREIEELVESLDGTSLTASTAILEAASGHVFGLGPLLRRAARELASVKGEREVPTVLVVGEIYVRCDPFANDFLIDSLEERGIRVRLAPMGEWLEYASDLNLKRGARSGLGAKISHRVQTAIQNRCYAAMAGPLGWGGRHGVAETLEAAADYIRADLWGEAVLTVGGPVHAWRAGEIDGAVNVGPLECMPAKLAEAQFFHVAEQEGLQTLSLGMIGEPIDPEILDSFAYEVHAAFEARRLEPARRRAWSRTVAKLGALLSGETAPARAGGVPRTLPRL
jgi:predicted nucleotide-binding protein (sugar kinase/HSP70/actin superfamily)